MNWARTTSAGSRPAASRAASIGASGRAGTAGGSPGGTRRVGIVRRPQRPVRRRSRISRISSRPSSAAWAAVGRCTGQAGSGRRAAAGVARPTSSMRWRSLWRSVPRPRERLMDVDGRRLEVKIPPASRRARGCGWPVKVPSSDPGRRTRRPVPASSTCCPIPPSNAAATTSIRRSPVDLFTGLLGGEVAGADAGGTVALRDSCRYAVRSHVPAHRAGNAQARTPERARGPVREGARGRLPEKLSERRRSWYASGRAACAAAASVQAPDLSGSASRSPDLTPPAPRRAMRQHTRAQT